jgi:hypothetical protein
MDSLIESVPHDVASLSFGESEPASHGSAHGIHATVKFVVACVSVRAYSPVALVVVVATRVSELTAGKNGANHRVDATTSGTTAIDVWLLAWLNCQWATVRAKHSRTYYGMLCLYGTLVAHEALMVSFGVDCDAMIDFQKRRGSVVLHDA